MIHWRIPDTTTLPPPSVSFACFQNASLIIRNKKKILYYDALSSCLKQESVIHFYHLLWNLLCNFRQNMTKKEKNNVGKGEWISNGPRSNYVQQGTLQLPHVERKKGMESNEHRNSERYQSWGGQNHKSRNKTPVGAIQPEVGERESERGGEKHMKVQAHFSVWEMHADRRSECERATWKAGVTSLFE